MTVGKASLLAVGFVGAVGLGVAIGMSVAARAPVPVPGFDAYMSAPPSPGNDFGAAPAASARPATPAAPATAAAASTSATAIAPSAPELHKRLKPLLNRGTDMARAADGFRDAQQFATVAHASHNTQVPFVVMKHRVLVEGKSVASVIREFKPEVDAAAEATRARDEAAVDIAEIEG